MLLDDKLYGGCTVLSGKEVFSRLRATEQSEHFQVLVNHNNNPHRIAINTKSSEAPSEVLYYADNDFHHALAQATHNDLIFALVDSIVNLLNEQRTRIFSVDGGPERGQTHHKHILEAIVRREPHAAHEAMRAHLRQVREDVAGAT